jgi:uncharacterized protein (TIGR04255 family)
MAATPPNLNCVFDDSPLMLASAQISFTQSPELIQRITDTKAGLAKLGMPLAEHRQTIGVAFTSGGLPPRLSQESFWWFSNVDRTRSVAVGPTAVALYDTGYSQFEAFRPTVCDLADVVQNVAGGGSFLTCVSLRYVSGFTANGSPCPFLIPGVQGLPPGVINTSHMHHNYSYWCDTATAGGKLTVSIKSVHGHEIIPQDIRTQKLSFNNKFTFQKKDDVIQIDIHETVKRKAVDCVGSASVGSLLPAMHDNVKSAFLISTSEEAHKKWKIRPKA